MNKITFRKRLFALAVCVFAWVGVNALDVSGNTVTLVPDDMSSLSYDSGNNSLKVTINNVTTSKSLDGVTTLKLSGEFSGWGGNALVNGGAWKSQITTIDLSTAHFENTTASVSETTVYLEGDNTTKKVVTVTNGWKFKDFTAVQTITWPTHGCLTVLPEECFMNCGIKNLTLPTTIKYICKHAFANCTKMEKVVFPDGIKNLLIVEEAFVQSSHITDVYVLTEDPIEAQFHAFDYMTTNAQTQADGSMAALHFPESQTANYANLDHQLDPETAYSPGKFQKWLTAHRTAARSSARGAGNGWHEFVTAGSMPPPDEVIETGDVILRTYSNLEYDHLTPKGFKAYIVTGVNADKELILESIPVIPARTGVILYGQSNAKTVDGKQTFVMTTVNYTGHALTRENHGQDSYSPMNCLVPTCFGEYKDGNNTVTVPQQVVGPYDVNNVNNPTAVTFRNFSLAKYSSTTSGKGTTDDKNYRGFFRLKLTNGVGVTMPNDKAYLKLSADEYPDYMGGECIVIKDAYYTMVYENQENNPKLILEHVDGKDDYWTKAVWEHRVSTGNWGVRSGSTTAKYLGEPIFEPVIEEKENGVATLIMPDGWLDSEMDSNNYYTLQGVKVTHPKKGIYIKDGKKIVVK